MRRKLGAALLVALMLTSCEDSVLDPTTEVTGKVVDHVTNQPLSGVTVSLSENDDVWLGGARVIAEQQTDVNGNFGFTFEWKESPYKIRVSKQKYTYHHVEYNEKFKNLPPVITDYQELESLNKKQSLIFDMEPVGALVVNITKSQPQASDSKLTIKFENVNKATPTVGPQVYTGNSISGFYVGGYAIAGKYVRYIYTIEKSGISQTTRDSVLIKHDVPTTLDISY
ncbi:hypothetical protein ACFSRY_15555 [Pontibacter locisalis]|uniref:Carboxypeptidase regulatory-like domain-containing protein n=1 Tax=Pontibacter locisalis TaxID=1719035 RepID=A0ABW5IPR9_9BACT